MPPIHLVEGRSDCDSASARPFKPYVDDEQWRALARREHRESTLPADQGSSMLDVWAKQCARLAREFATANQNDTDFVYGRSPSSVGRLQAARLARR